MKVSIKEKILRALGGTFLVVLFGLLIFDITRRGVYGGKMGINVAVVGETGASILLLRPEEDMFGWVRLPKDIRIKVFNTEAFYPLESMWSYGVSLHNPFEIMEKSLGQSMGIVVARTIKLNDSSLIENVLGALFQVGLKTDLSVRDRVMIRRFLADAVKSKKVLELTIPNSVFDKVTDPDGKDFLEFNSTMSLWTKNKFAVESILNENTEISINNVSGVTGAGNVLASQLWSVGMHVVEVKADLEEKVEGKGCLYSASKQYEMVEAVLRDQVGCSKIIKPGFVGEDELVGVKIWIK